jgi:hypothetical protein
MKIRPLLRTGSATRVRAMLASATAVIVATVAMVAGLSGTSSAQTLPDPHTFVSNLDLECWQTVPYTPAFPPILTHHLNPVLSGLPDEKVTLGARQQLCSPVAKNGVIPPSSVLPFIQYVDLSCYQVTGINVNRPLNLTQLNPVLAGLPPQNVVMTSPQQLCVPVIKNNMSPPAAVLALVQYIDLKCYAITPPASANVPLTLSQLDPVLASMPAQKVTMQNNRQLCVPVQKNNQAIPANVLNIVRWIDLEKYDVTPSTPVSPFALALNHINPLLVTLPTEQTSLTQPLQLAVPVAKNGAIPPSS